MKDQHSIQTEDDRLLVSRVADAARIAESRRSPKFIGFLDLHQKKVAQQAVQEVRADCRYLFWGGFIGAERSMLGLFPSYDEPEPALFPISLIEITFKPTDPAASRLTHRDFLGSLLSLGIRRDKTGDLIVMPDRCVAAVDAAIAAFVISNLTKVGGVGVGCAAYEGQAIEKIEHFKNIEDTIASGRLDCVVAALVNASRSEAERLIAGGMVSKDFETALNGASKVCEGSTVSIRGHGRFIIDAVGPPTKKGRLKFSARKYL